MKEILDDQLNFQSTQISDYKFIGKLAVTSWKYDGALNYLKNIRWLIGIMGMVMFYPILTNYLFLDFFSFDIFIERVVFCVILFICAGLYQRFRVVSTIIALLPIGLLLFFSLTNLEYFSVKQFGFNGAVFLIIAAGLFYHFREKKLKKALEVAILNKHPDAIIRKK